MQLVEIRFGIYNYGDFYFDENKLDFTYDEDFCLFKDFPFNQLILFNIYIEKMVKSNLSCTTLWLTQYYPVYYQLLDANYVRDEISTSLEMINSRSRKSCDFNNRLEKCNKTGFVRKQSNSFNSSFGFDLIVISQFLLILFTPLICLFGIVTNILVILVVVKKQNRKELKEKQYSYMAINSASNIIVCFIEVISLMGECQYPFGIFCSTIRRVFVQYLKIILVETVSSCFRLISNFSFLAFSVNRLSLVGKNKGLVEFFSQLSIVKFMIVSVLISSEFSIVKRFRFRLNLVDPIENYPLIFYRNILDVRRDEHKTSYTLIFVFGAIYDFVNYVVFTLVNIIVDFVLLYKLKKVLREKEEKRIVLMANSSEEAKERAKAENDEAVRRATKMIVSSALLNLVCKFPSAVISFNDLRVLIVTPTFEQLLLGVNWGRRLFELPYTMKHICYVEEVCIVFQNFGNFLYLILLSTYLFFYYIFDKNFKRTFKDTFKKRIA